jgi:hypothetical protein
VPPTVGSRYDNPAFGRDNRGCHGALPTASCYAFTVGTIARGIACQGAVSRRGNRSEGVRECGSRETPHGNGVVRVVAAIPSPLLTGWGVCQGVLGTPEPAGPQGWAAPSRSRLCRKPLPSRARKPVVLHQSQPPAGSGSGTLGPSRGLGSRPPKEPSQSRYSHHPNPPSPPHSTTTACTSSTSSLPVACQRPAQSTR